MKLFVKLMIGVFVLAMMGPFFIKKPDGSPLVSLRDFEWFTTFYSWFTTAPIIHANRPNTTQPIAEGDTGSDDVKSTVNSSPSEAQFYKWQDLDGVWHYGDTLPDKSRVKQVQKVSVDPRANIIQMAAPKQTVATPLGQTGSRVKVLGSTPIESGQEQDTSALDALSEGNFEQALPNAMSEVMKNPELVGDWVNSKMQEREKQLNDL